MTDTINPQSDNLPEKQVPLAQKPFDVNELDGAGQIGYVPIPTNIPGVVDGSLWSANFKDSTAIGSFLDTDSARALDRDEQVSTQELIEHVPIEHIDDADLYVGIKLEDFPIRTETINREREQKQLIATHPLKSFAIGLLEQPLDSVNWLPFGAIYNNAKRGSRLVRSIVGSGVAGAAGALTQEAIISRNQVARETQESVFNTLTSGLLGATLGGIGAGLTIRGRLKSIEQRSAREKLRSEIMDVYTDNDKPLTPEGLLKSEDIARMPPLVQKAMLTTPMNRLLKSQFGFSKWFASQMYENNYTLNKNIEGDAKQISVERFIRQDTRKTEKVLVDYDNIYFQSVGIDKGSFKGTRAKLAGITADAKAQFDNDVWTVLSTEVESTNEHVNRAAHLMREKIFDPAKDRLIELGLLPESVRPRNAANYVMSVYNKDLIIEQGGKSARGAGTFPDTLHKGFSAIRDEVKAFKESPTYKSLTEKISENREKLKGIPKEQRVKVDKQISNINKQIKEFEKLKAARPKDEVKKINENIKSAQKEIKKLQSEIIENQQERKRQIDSEIRSFKDELESTRKKIAPFNNEIKKLETRRQKARERRTILTERLKSKSEGTKTFENINNELDKIDSVIIEIEKNIQGLKAERDNIKPTLSDIKSDIKRLEGIRKLEAKEVPELKEKIKEIESNIKELQESKRPTKEQIQKLEKEIKQQESKIKELEKSKDLGKKEKDSLEQSIQQLETNLFEATPERLLDSNNKLFPVLDDEQLWAQVEQTIDNILGDNEGVLVNPIMQRIKSIGADPTKARKMSVEQVLLREWQITNMAKLAEIYTRATSPLIRLAEFAQRNGAKDINEFKNNLEKEINKEFDALVAGKTGKEAQRIRKMRDDNINDMSATFQLLEGVYGDGPNVLNNSARNFYQNFLKWNASRLLGFMTMSSFPDAGIQVFTHGFYRFMHDGILGSFSEARNIARQDLRAIGYAMETELGSRLKSYSDTQGLSINPSPFTRGLDVLSRNFGNLSLMNQWNELMQSIAGHIGINRTLQTIHKVVKGEKVSEKEILRLNKLGLERKHFQTIFEYTRNNDSDGTLFADWQNWDIQTPAQREALEQFQATVGKEIDEIVIVPGLGDKPLLGQRPLGRLLFQFKTFLMASTNRVLIPAIQNRNDINTYLGIVSMLGLGALSYISTTLVKGKELDLSFDNMAKESIDRSGLLGIYGEFLNIGAKVTGIGGVSRYQSRNAMGALLGPSFGAGTEVVSMIRTIFDAARGKEDITTRDVDKFMRLFPLQNLATSLEIPKKLIKGGAKELGAIDVDD